MTRFGADLMYLLTKAAAALPLVGRARRIRLLARARRFQILRRGGTEATARLEARTVASTLTTAAACLEQFRRLESAEGRGDLPRDATRLKVRGNARLDATTAPVAEILQGLDTAPDVLILGPEDTSERARAFTAALIGVVKGQAPGRTLLVIGQDRYTLSGRETGGPVTLRRIDRLGAEVARRDMAQVFGHLVRALVPERLIVVESAAAWAMIDDIGLPLAALSTLETALLPPTQSERTRAERMRAERMRADWTEDDEGEADQTREAEALCLRWPFVTRVWLATPVGGVSRADVDVRLTPIPL